MDKTKNSVQWAVSKNKMKTLTNGQVREILAKSIAKWEAIVAQSGKDEGADNCALCDQFFHQFRDARGFPIFPILDDGRMVILCSGCPVSVYSGESHCINTPYMSWAVNRSSAADDRGMAVTKSDVKLAQAEVDFLKMLDHYFFEE